MEIIAEKQIFFIRCDLTYDCQISKVVIMGNSRAETLLVGNFQERGELTGIPKKIMAGTNYYSIHIIIIMRLKIK